jgi:hypothetical protein
MRIVANTSGSATATHYLDRASAGNLLMDIEP